MPKEDKRQEQKLAFIANKIYGRGWRRGLSEAQIIETMGMVAVLLENRPMPQNKASVAIPVSHSPLEFRQYA